MMINGMIVTDSEIKLLVAFTSDYATELFYLYGKDDPLYLKVKTFLGALLGTEFTPTARSN